MPVGCLVLKTCRDTSAIVVVKDGGRRTGSQAEGCVCGWSYTTYDIVSRELELDSTNVEHKGKKTSASGRSIPFQDQKIRHRLILDWRGRCSTDTATHEAAADS